MNERDNIYMYNAISIFTFYYERQIFNIKIIIPIAGIKSIKFIHFLIFQKNRKAKKYCIYSSCFLHITVERNLSITT